MSSAVLAEPEWRLAYEPKVKPGPGGQAAFHQDRYAKRYRGLLGGTGGGKTYCAVAEDLAVALLHPGTLGLACAPDIPDVKRVLYPIYEAHLGLPRLAWYRHPIVARWHDSDHVLDLRNGSRIQFLGLDDEIEGDTVNWEHITEGRLVRRWRDKWASLKRRLRAPGYQGAWMDTHSPTKEIVDEWEAGDPDYGVYRWSTRDAHLAGVIGDAYYLDMVRSHHGARAQAVLEGLYARAEGLVYDAWDPIRMVRPRPDPPLGSRDPNTPVWTQAMSYGLDFGYTHASCLTAWAWSGAKCHGVDEYWARFRKPTELVEEVLTVVQRWGAGVVWCGSDEPGTVALLRDAGVDARILPPEKRKVVDGTRQVNGMMHAEELLVDPAMKHFLEEVDQYANEPERDEPEKDAPDACDSARYGVYGHSRYAPGPASTVRKAVSRAPRTSRPGELYGVDAT